MTLFRYRLSATGMRAAGIRSGRIASLATRMDASDVEVTLPPLRRVGDGIVVRTTPGISEAASITQTCFCGSLATAAPVGSATRSVTGRGSRQLIDGRHADASLGLGNVAPNAVFTDTPSAKALSGRRPGLRDECVHGTRTDCYNATAHHDQAAPNSYHGASDRVAVASAPISPATDARPLEAPRSVLSFVGDASQFVMASRWAAEPSRVRGGRAGAAAPIEPRGVVEVPMPPAERVRS